MTDERDSDMLFNKVSHADWMGSSSSDETEVSEVIKKHSKKENNVIGTSKKVEAAFDEEITHLAEQEVGPSLAESLEIVKKYKDNAKK